MLNKPYIDLHIHSNNSDGSFSSQTLINIAENNGVGIIAITDHDSIDGLEEFKSSINDNMMGINGIEFSSFINFDNEKNNIHILGYGIDENNPLFQYLIKEMKEKRINAHIKLLNELREKLNNIPEDEISKLNIERYCWFDREIIRCFENAKYPQQIIEQLKKYYNINKFNYGIDYNLEARRVIDIIHSAGGYAIFAHPMAYGFAYDKTKSIINKLIDIGIDGIELYQSDCSINDIIFLKQILEDTMLLYSVGSDFHRIINSDGRKIGLGINNNLCITETTLTDELIRKKQYFKKMN